MRRPSPFSTPTPSAGDELAVPQRRSANPSHPAKMVQPRIEVGWPDARPPHPAKVAQPRIEVGRPDARPPHPAKVAQRRAAAAPSQRGAVQRSASNDEKDNQQFMLTAGKTAVVSLPDVAVELDLLTGQGQDQTKVLILKALAAQLKTKPVELGSADLSGLGETDQLVVCGHGGYGGSVGLMAMKPGDLAAALKARGLKKKVYQILIVGCCSGAEFADHFFYALKKLDLEPVYIIASTSIVRVTNGIVYLKQDDGSYSALTDKNPKRVVISTVFGKTAKYVGNVETKMASAAIFDPLNPYF